MSTDPWDLPTDEDPKSARPPLDAPLFLGDGDREASAEVFRSHMRENGRQMGGRLLVIIVAFAVIVMGIVAELIMGGGDESATPNWQLVMVGLLMAAFLGIAIWQYRLTRQKEPTIQDWVEKGEKERRASFTPMIVGSAAVLLIFVAPTAIMLSNGAGWRSFQFVVVPALVLFIGWLVHREVRKRQRRYDGF